MNMRTDFVGWSQYTISKYNVMLLPQMQKWEVWALLYSPSLPDRNGWKETKTHASLPLTSGLQKTFIVGEVCFQNPRSPLWPVLGTCLTPNSRPVPEDKEISSPLLPAPHPAAHWNAPALCVLHTIPSFLGSCYHSPDHRKDQKSLKISLSSLPRQTLLCRWGFLKNI